VAVVVVVVVMKDEEDDNRAVLCYIHGDVLALPRVTTLRFLLIV
jgi:hypothetical protein